MKHEIKIQHGYVEEKEDVWIGEFEKQPKIFQVEISPGTTSLLKYEFHTGRFSDEFKYFN